MIAMQVLHILTSMLGLFVLGIYETGSSDLFTLG
jgi:hypothetical protein